MIRIFDSEEEVAREIAREMQQRLAEDEQSVFCLASGSTPQKSYAHFASSIGGNDGSLKNLRIVSLDEWVGIERSSEGSCYQMLNQDLFSLIPLESDQIEFFDGTAADLVQECSRIDQYIEQYPMTFSLMGVGMNGHIGLNEPGSAVLEYSSVIDLSATTKEVAQKYFHERTVLSEGITLGLGQVIRSQRVITVITGERKAEIVREIFCNPDAKLPAQALLGYDHIDFYLDAKAAKYLDISGEQAG
ncbi:6-phosphogluconolactonase [Paenibacillus sp. OV219]|uniref:6-phosphogluconolactonase n=1 Tax=Paenibacillus sp. OV219 TaxID=1884377 RepID=UPI0008D7D1A7|nr:6-phosphogluconolactonase [Paenibacillus sp. OV219]SEN51812.1 6-phosphogluconolactonase/Glucosamine-6-phosphateisomerase/deaminase [Paenibacillus sp. OV219]